MGADEIVPSAIDHRVSRHTPTAWGHVSQTSIFERGEDRDSQRVLPDLHHSPSFRPPRLIPALPTRAYCPPVSPRRQGQFVIPIYQRTYSWTDKECRQLWEDILRAGRDDKISVHFIGSIVCVEEGLGQVTHQAPLLVIDGQQRLTTVCVLLAALASSLGDQEPVDGFSTRKVGNTIWSIRKRPASGTSSCCSRRLTKPR